MRDHLIGYLKDLSDTDMQKVGWTNANGALDYAIHFLFDDTKLAADPADYIGWCLRDGNEAKAILKITVSIDALLNAHGTELKDIEYTSKPEWKIVVRAAESALSALNERGKQSPH